MLAGYALRCPFEYDDDCDRSSERRDVCDGNGGAGVERYGSAIGRWASHSLACESGRDPLLRRSRRRGGDGSLGLGLKTISCP